MSTSFGTGVLASNGETKVPGGRLKQTRSEAVEPFGMNDDQSRSSSIGLNGMMVLNSLITVKINHPPKDTQKPVSFVREMFDEELVIPASL